MSDETKDVAALAAEVKAQQEKQLGEVKEIAEKALSGVETSQSEVKKMNEKADEALLNMNALTERVADLDQKMANAAAFEQAAAKAKSLGQQFIEDDAVKAFLDTEEKRGKVALSLKATITSATTDAAGSVGSLVETTRLNGIVATPDRKLTVRDLILSGQMNGNSLEYIRETGFNNNAAPVAEGATKPQSDIQMEMVTTSARVIAHTMKASRQIMDDAAQLRSYIDGRLRYGLAYAEEQQLLNGDGTGQNLKGIVPQATAYSAPITITGETAIDKMRQAMLQAVLAEYPANGHVMNPIDWARIELEKDSQGRYIIGNPQGRIAPTLWGLPVVETQAISPDKFLTGAFNMGAQVFDRWAARVEIATQNGTDFEENKITMLCEERLALAVYRPEAFIYGDLGNVA